MTRGDRHSRDSVCLARPRCTDPAVPTHYELMLPGARWPRRQQRADSFAPAVPAPRDRQPFSAGADLAFGSRHAAPGCVR